jgi:hypothetical protein
MYEYDYEMFDINTCKPRKSVIVEASPKINGYERFTIRFDCKKIYDYICGAGEIYWVIPDKGIDYMIPFSVEDFNKRFEDVCVEDKA